MIPSKSTRRHPAAFDRDLYKQRNLIERMFNKLKNWRRVATRYDRLACNYLAAIALVSCVIAWT